MQFYKYSSASVVQVFPSKTIYPTTWKLPLTLRQFFSTRLFILRCFFPKCYAAETCNKSKLIYHPSPPIAFSRVSGLRSHRARYYARSRFFLLLPRSSFHPLPSPALSSHRSIPLGCTGYFCRQQILLCRTATRTSATALKTVSSRCRHLIF